MSDRKVISLADYKTDYKTIQDVVKGRCGDEFFFGYVGKDKKYYLYVSGDMLDIDIVYLKDMLTHSAHKRMYSDDE